MTCAEVVRLLDTVAPPHFAEAWDNVGLLAGDPSAAVSRGLLCIDYTPAVAAEAVAAGIDFLLAYHPPLFKPVNRLTADGPAGLVFDAIRRGLAIYSPHTALDAAEGGTNDVLADVLGLTDRMPLRHASGTASSCKLVTFVPTYAADGVADALFVAGAGRVGDYSSCAFRAEGVGTFIGGDEARPAVGQTGRLERVPEVRLETVVPLAAVAGVLTALRSAHPYETPAFDLVTLHAPPVPHGIGRVGRVETTTVGTIAETLKAGLALPHLIVGGEATHTVTRVAVCAGAGGDLLDDAISAHADLFVSGELRHHDALRARAAGLAVLCTLHSNSERVTLSRLAGRLRAVMPAIDWHLSTADADPFVLA